MFYACVHVNVCSQTCECIREMHARHVQIKLSICKKISALGQLVHLAQSLYVAYFSQRERSQGPKAPIVVFLGTATAANFQEDFQLGRLEATELRHITLGKNTQRARGLSLLYH